MLMSATKLCFFSNVGLKAQESGVWGGRELCIKKLHTGHRGEACAPLLGGLWVVLSRVTSRVTILITHIRGCVTSLMTTHEPASAA